ncbi:Os02g0525251 [Oryza sativa Japonica Group]|uniref:Os02g0525251 protein n=1 Tax=Oryza sativa subsp. japonica TaxID=39947 RepID=A0A0P0VJV2_ORYSJ|nr:Os02g0525251 [Oryza sativa Japonica Group]
MAVVVAGGGYGERLARRRLRWSVGGEMREPVSSSRRGNQRGGGHGCPCRLRRIGWRRGRGTGWAASSSSSGCATLSPRSSLH